MSKSLKNLTAITTAALLITTIPSLEATLERSTVKSQAQAAYNAGEVQSDLEEAATSKEETGMAHGQDIDEDRSQMSRSQQNQADDVKEQINTAKEQKAAAETAGTVGTGDTVTMDEGG